MGTTPRFGLRYPALGDAPNGPQLAQQLAEDVEGWLTRAFPCTSTTRPTSPPDAMLIRESDTGLVLIWTGAEWATVGGTVDPGGGGGGASGGEAQYSASSPQSIPSTTDTAVAFGTADATTGLVTRAASGSGHEFTLTQAGVWAIATTVRYGPHGTDDDGEHYIGIHAPDAGDSDGNPLAAAGGYEPLGNPATRNAAVTRRFPAGSVVFIDAWQGTGSTRELEPGDAGGWVRINLAWLRA